MMDLREHFRTQAVSRMQEKLGRADRCAMRGFLARGVPVSRAVAEQLRLQRWSLMGGTSARGAACVSWVPGGEALSCVGGNTVWLYTDWRGSESAAAAACDRPMTALAAVPGTELNRLRWHGPHLLAAVGHSSRRVWLADVAPERVALNMLECDAMTTMQEVALSGAHMVYAGGRDGALYGWDRRVGGRPKRVPPLALSTGSITGLHASADGQLLVSASHLGIVSVWDTRMTVRALKRFAKNVTSLDTIAAMDVCGSRVALQSASRRACVLDLVSQQCSECPVALPAADLGGLPSVSLMPLSTYVAVCVGPCVKLCDVGTRVERGATCSVQFVTPLTSVAAHPTGECVAYGLESGAVGFIGRNIRDSDDGGAPLKG